MTRLVPEIAHRFFGALDRRGVVLFDLRQARVSEIKRNPDQRGSVGTAPLVAQVDWRPELEPLRRQLFVELIDQSLQQRPADLQSDIGDSLRQKRMTLAFPIRGSFFHESVVGQAAYPV